MKNRSQRGSALNVIDAPKTVTFLMDGDLTKERLMAAAEILSSEANPIDDIFSIAEYCRQAIKGLLIRNLWQYTR